MRKLILLLVLVFSLSATVPAQSLSNAASSQQRPSTATPTQNPQDDPVLRACEEAADKLKAAQAENELLKQRLAIAEERIKNKDEQITNLKEQSDFWKQAAQTGDKLDTTNGFIIQELRNQHAADLDEIGRLRVENEKLRGSRNLRTVLGFGIGLGTGALINR